MNKTVLFVTTLNDLQTGVYIRDAFKKLGWKVILFDYNIELEKISNINPEYKKEKMFYSLMKIVKTEKIDLLLSLKSIYVWPDIVEEAKKRGIYTACWMFDTTLNGKKIIEDEGFIKLIKVYDVFYSFCNNIEELRANGVNAKQLKEGYDEDYNSKQQLSSIKTEEIGADVVFIGSFSHLFRERIKYLSKISEEGFDFKIYGITLPEDKFTKDEVELAKKHHQNIPVANKHHSYVCQSSKICLGLDGWPEIDESFSARLYRTLACGGFYLMRHTKGVEKYFKPGIHLDVFEDEEDMIKKIKYYLSHTEERERIAMAGMEEVKKHTFTNRIKEEFGRGDKYD